AARPLLHVGEEGERRALQPLARRAGRDRLDDARDDVLDLAVHDDRVEAFLAAEVLVDDRLRDAGAVRDLLDRCGLVAALREHHPADVDELRAPCRRGEAWAPRLPRNLRHVDTLTTVP